MLVGRDDVCGVVDELVERMRAGAGGALVLRGEAGVGKTALLDHAGTGPGLRVLRATGVQAESELPYASAHQLLRPLLPLADGLPVPQARAVRVALGLEEGGAPDRFLVALGFLSLLSDAARERPVLGLVDDVQWCDTASGDALAFVVRRLASDPVGLLFAVRNDPTREPFELPGVPELTLDGLDETATGHLLKDAAPEVVKVLCQKTRGNPLALKELARALNDDQLSGRAPLPEPLPVGDRLERAFLDRVRTLPEAAQRLLLVAAADEYGEPGVIVAAAGQGEDALTEAERSGLVAIRQDRLEFSHPLVRSAVYSAAPSARRRAAHQALADALEGHPDRRIWHLAAAAQRQDETVAAQLEDAAGRAHGRGGDGSAAYERAADLSPDAEPRARRLLAAAETAWMAGHATRARALIARAEPLTADPALRAGLLHLRGKAAARGGEVNEAYRALTEGARHAAPELALEMLAEAAGTTAYSGDAARSARAAELAAGLEPSTTPRARFLSACLSLGTAALHGGTAEDTAGLRDEIGLANGFDDPGCSSGQASPACPSATFSGCGTSTAGRSSAPVAPEPWRTCRTRWSTCR